MPAAAATLPTTEAVEQQKAAAGAIGTQFSDFRKPRMAARRKVVIGSLTGAGALILAVVMVAFSGTYKSFGVEELTRAPVDNYQAEGTISQVFALGSQNTNAQREAVTRELTGKVVNWTLPVYEVNRSGDTFTIQTQQRNGVFGSGNELVGTFVTVIPQSTEEKSYLELLRTGEGSLPFRVERDNLNSRRQLRRGEPANA
jgi:hypothetical protein